jgi:hypothetical protein
MAEAAESAASLTLCRNCWAELPEAKAHHCQEHMDLYTVLHEAIEELQADYAEAGITQAHFHTALHMYVAKCSPPVDTKLIQPLPGKPDPPSTPKDNSNHDKKRARKIDTE